MNSINTIFFDWGGVIADDPGNEFLSLLLKNIGASDEQVQIIYDTYMRRFMRGELSEAEYWNELRINYGLTIHDSISDDFKNWRGLYKNDDILALVTKARALGLQTAVLSNVIEPTYNVLLAAGYYDYFDEVIASCQVGFAKPQQEIYQIALDRLHTTAAQSVFIDDKQKNLTPAEKMGFETILAQNPKQIIDDLTNYFPT